MERVRWFNLSATRGGDRIAKIADVVAPELGE
jgi:hypothetical protein